MTSAEQNDLFAEFVNVGLGRAASTLSELCGHEVRLSVPEADVTAHSEFVALFERSEEPVTLVREDFSGAVEGQACLVLPIGASRALLHGLLVDAPEETGFSELADGALAEAGNIILNAMLSSFADMLDASFAASAPICEVAHGSDWVRELSKAGSRPALVVRIHFAIGDDEVSSHVVFIVPEFEKLLMHVDALLAALQ